ncbi:MAG: peptidylprolyl isomerase [Planctomycetes bacterium]|nr:peptidylprolyl isomerase [Planctomycetota bacterium]
MSATAPLCFLLLTATALAAPQAPDEVLATYRLEGRPMTVTRADVALEMAFHLRRRDRGREAVDMLVDSMMTRSEARKHGLTPTRADAEAFWQKLQKQLLAAGVNPSEVAAVRNTDEERWLEDLKVQIAQERLVRRELGLPAKEKVSGDMLKLWIGEARKRHRIETDPDSLPVGTAAKVDDQVVPLIDLGMLLLRTSEDFERDRFIRQVVYLQSIEKMAERRNLEVSATDLDVAIEARRQQARKDPRFSQVKFEELLKAQGLSVTALRQLRTFRSQILLDKLALAEFPDDKLRAELEQDRRKVLDLVGPRRRIGMIFVRARAVPNAIVTRSFEQAKAHLLKVRERIAKDGFAATASIESEHGQSKRSGGDVGWHRVSSKQLPAVIVDAAFALGTAEVSMPLQDDNGCYLVTVLDKEPMPDDDELLRRLRVQRAQQFSERILEDAKVEIVGADDQPQGQEQGKGK